ncbi:MAG: Nif3-like dinuclear metal center hexameric protein [Oleiphilus sp.]
MPVKLNDLLSYIDKTLAVNSIQDYCPNGLQVEGKPEIKKLIGGVTASQALIDAAIARKADAILVHHGYFWKGEDQAISGIKKQRIKALLDHDISLLAYHLPLDLHPVVGNNAQLAKLLELTNIRDLDAKSKHSIAIAADLAKPLTAKEFNDLISQKLQRQCFHVGDESKLIKTIGLCTGAAQGMITQAVEKGMDGYLSGEISEPTFHIANETGVNYFSAGHHATERGGVIALGEKLAEEFDLEFEFIDIDNPV